MSEQGILLPFYLVVDVSYSMMGDKIGAANQILPSVADALAKNPILGRTWLVIVLTHRGDLWNLLFRRVTDTLAAPEALCRSGGTLWPGVFRGIRHWRHVSRHLALVSDSPAQP